MKIIITLKCIECVRNEHRDSQYDVYFSDENNQKYFISIHDFVPINAIVEINLSEHKIIKKDDYWLIYVLQKDYLNNQNEFIFEITNIYKLEDYDILTLKEINTNKVFKQKTNSGEFIINEITTINLKESKLIISSMPHYYNEYTVEDWIFNNIIIATF